MIAHSCLHAAVAYSAGARRSGSITGSGFSAASRGVNLPGISTRLSPNTVAVAKSISACVMSARKAWAMVVTVSSDATAGMVVDDVESVFSSAIASRASASLPYTSRFLERKNAMRLAVTEAHEPRSSSFTARIRDCKAYTTELWREVEGGGKVSSLLSSHV